MSVDPLANSYPWYTPFQFAGNNPVWAIDLDGMEEQITNAIIGTVTKPALPIAIPAATREVTRQIASKTFINEAGELIWGGLSSGAKAGTRIVGVLGFLLTPANDPDSPGYRSEKEFGARMATRSGLRPINSTPDATRLANLERMQETAGLHPHEEQQLILLLGSVRGIHVVSKLDYQSLYPSLPTGSTSVARQLLREAFDRQTLNSPPNEIKEKWSANGYDYEVRIHGPQAKAPSGSNSANTTTFIVSRRLQGLNSNGQGNGWERADDSNNWYSEKDLKSGKMPQEANDTHIPLKR